MELAALHPAIPHILTLVFGFTACSVSGILSMGEGIVFMLLYNISRSSGLLGDNASYFNGLLLAQVLGFCTGLPIIFAGRHEMSLTLGYGILMTIVSLRFITMGVGLLLSGHEDAALGYAAAMFMMFSFVQLSHATLQFGEERALETGSAPASSPRRPDAILDASGTIVISTQDVYSAPHGHLLQPLNDHLLQLISKLAHCLRAHPHHLAPLYNASPRSTAHSCCNFILTTLFPDDGSPTTDRQMSAALAALIHAEASACTDTSLLLREDSLAALLVSSYCLRKQPQDFLSRLLHPIFCGVRAADTATSSSSGHQRHIHYGSAAVSEGTWSVGVIEACLRGMITEICARMHELPLGVKCSSAALVNAVSTLPQHQHQPLSHAAAIGSILFLRYIVPFTVQYGMQHPSAQRFFIDIGAALQKISNGTEFPAAHKLSSLNAALRELSATLHVSLLATCSACGQSHVTDIQLASLSSTTPEPLSCPSINLHDVDINNLRIIVPLERSVVVGKTTLCAEAGEEHVWGLRRTLTDCL